jgi:predicted alpha/beta-fold hydrolase
MLETLAGHFWTIAPVVRHRLSPRVAPVSTPWELALDDARYGTVMLRGLLRDVPGSDAAVVIVHGLGGTFENHYCISAALAAEQLGVSSLRLALRGADRDGEDLYHAGLAADLHAVLRSPALARFTRLYVLGFSLGGHVTLRAALTAASERDPRLRAVAAICAPLDLELSAVHIDGPRARIYRRHVLTGLKEMYEAVARRRELPTPLERVLAVRTIREWDALAIVPRFGFGTVERYYAEMSVGPALAQLALPALLAQHRADPMVPPHAYERHLARKPDALELRWLPAGGHVGYPSDVSLGEQGPLGVEAQAISWLLRH